MNQEFFKYLAITLVAVLVCILLGVLKKIKWLIIAAIITGFLAIKTGGIYMVKDYIPTTIELPEKDPTLTPPDIEMDVKTPKMRYYIDDNAKGYGLDFADEIKDKTPEELLNNAENNINSALDNAKDVMDSASDTIQGTVSDSVEIIKEGTK